MGATWRSAELADHVVLLGAFAASPKGFPRSAPETVGCGVDIRMAVSEPALQSRLRTTVLHERGAHLRDDGPPDAPTAGSDVVFRQFLVSRSIAAPQTATP